MSVYEVDGRLRVLRPALVGLALLGAVGGGPPGRTVGERLVVAQDEERRRLERDLHDGAQQQIVALKLTAATARTLLERGDVERTAQLLTRLVEDTDDAVESLRELAHGIYPPLLEAEGLGPAIRARAAKLPVAVTVESDTGRCPPEVEAAVYFCILEALQNVTKYAAAQHVRVEVAKDGHELRFRVTDDGRGFDPDGIRRGAGLTNMSDRIDALGGVLTIGSTPGQGTRIDGRAPSPLDDAAVSNATASGGGGAAVAPAG